MCSFVLNHSISSGLSVLLTSKFRVVPLAVLSRKAAPLEELLFVCLIDDLQRSLLRPFKYEDGIFSH